MTRLIFALCLFAIGPSGFAQDTIKVEPFDIGLPEIPSISFGPKDKYGPDTTRWPGWMQKGFDRSKGMLLEVIDTESLRLNDTLRLEFDSARSYTLEKGDSVEGRKLKDFYFQDNLVFIEGDSTVEFLSLKEPVKDGASRLTATHNGKRIDLSSLATIEKTLPKCYVWRDAIFTWVAGAFYTPEEQIRITMIPISLSSNKRDMIELAYYDDRLVYIFMNTH